MSLRDSFTSAGLAGLRVLLVEDSPVVGPFTAELLHDLGCVVIGPAPTMAAARELIVGDIFDVAIMDIHIRGERVYPLCDLLDERRIPFVLTSGYADWEMPERLQGRPRLQKPYKIGDVEQALAALGVVAA